MTAPCRQGINTNKKKYFTVSELLFEILVLKTFAINKT